MNILKFLKILFLFFSGLAFGEALLIISSGKIFYFVTFLVLLFSVVSGLAVFIAGLKYKLCSLFHILLVYTLGLVYFFSVMFILGEGGYSNSSKWELANNYIGLASDSIEKYREDNGKCPTSLEDLQGYPLKFLDPFNSKEKLLKYHSGQNYCVVYSVGLDRVDDKAMVVLKNNSLDNDWHSTQLSYSLVSFLYKDIFDESKTLGDLVKKIN